MRLLILAGIYGIIAILYAIILSLAIVRRQKIGFIIIDSILLLFSFALGIMSVVRYNQLKTKLYDVTLFLKDGQKIEYKDVVFDEVKAIKIIDQKGQTYYYSIDTNYIKEPAGKNK
jgi:hypothetical protein